jgi:dTDP-glucose 4,6-dehydratase
LKLRHELCWQPEETFASGIRKTIAWYLEHQDWAGRLEQRRGLGFGGGAGLAKPGAFEA